MTFNPKQHLIQLKGKDYLETRFRIQWFRDEHPAGQIGTEVVSTEPLIIKATICSADGVILATGHGSAIAKPNAVWAGREIEKAETAAIGRALAHAGYGTQFAGDDDADYLADSPVERKPEDHSIETTVCTAIDVGVTKKEKRSMLQLHCSDGLEIVEYTREKFRSIGYDVETWNVPGTHINLDPPAIVDWSYDDRGYIRVESVRMQNGA